MDRMYPPELLVDDVKSDQERELFDALRDELPDEWEVFHSASFILRDHAAGADDDEVDFVLVHPDRAIVCLEVKGGGFECRHGEFFRVKDGVHERMKDPFQQALDHRYDFGRFLDANVKGAGSNTFLVHALAFPNVSVHSLVLAPDAPHEIVIDRIEIREGMASAIDKVLAYHEGSRDKRQAPGEDVAKRVRDLLAPTHVLEVTLAAEIDSDERRIIALTEEQKDLINGLARAPRVSVTGMAGSGKTLLAIEHAKRRAALSRDVLYVCFNRALADDLAARISEPGLRIVNFHKLCVDAALAAGIRPTWHEKADAPSEYFSEELPNALADAATAAGGLFDDIVIDEAQDLTDAYFTALNFTLRDASTAHVWIFRDDNQKVFGDAFRVPDEFLPFDLATNVRNTQAIHRAVMALYEGDLNPVCAGPPGRPVEVIKSHDVAKTVGEVISGLRTKGDVEATDIVVLSSHPLKSSKLGSREYDDFVFVTKAWGAREVEDDARDRIRFESIRAFKGLEAAVVVLCELEDIADDSDREREAYVGLSRARAHCVVVARGGR